MSIGPKKWQRIILAGLFSVYLVLLSAVILFKLPFYSPQLSDGIRVINLDPLAALDYADKGVAILEIFFNVLFFVPLGIYITILRRHWSFFQKVLPIFLLSLTFETLQYIFAWGRSDIVDVIANTLGGIIGIGLALLLFGIFKRRANAVALWLTFALTVIVVVRFAQLFYLSHVVMAR